MNDDIYCGYPGDRSGALIAHLYGEDGPEAQEFAAHVATCAACRRELDELRGVRGRLTEWAPPEPVGALTAPAGPSEPGGLWRTLSGIPVWAQIAAASLIVGLSVGLANLDVRYGENGLTIHSGWWPLEAEAVSAGDQEPWRAELAALRAELESGLSEARTAAVAQVDPDPSVDQPAPDAVMQQVRALIAESDRRHQRELALRVGEVLRDVNTQRRVDLQNIDRSLGTLQNNMGLELLKQREQVNNYMLRVSTQK